MMKKLLLLALFTNINSYSVSFNVCDALYDNVTPSNNQTPKGTIKVFGNSRHHVYVTDETLFLETENNSNLTDQTWPTKWLTKLMYEFDNSFTNINFFKHIEKPYKNDDEEDNGAGGFTLVGQYKTQPTKAAIFKVQANNNQKINSDDKNTKNSFEKNKVTIKHEIKHNTPIFNSASIQFPLNENPDDDRTYVLTGSSWPSIKITYQTDDNTKKYVTETFLNNCFLVNADSNGMIIAKVNEADNTSFWINRRLPDFISDPNPKCNMTLYAIFFNRQYIKHAYNKNDKDSDRLSGSLTGRISKQIDKLLENVSLQSLEGLVGINKTYDLAINVQKIGSANIQKKEIQNCLLSEVKTALGPNCAIFFNPHNAPVTPVVVQSKHSSYLLQITVTNENSNNLKLAKAFQSNIKLTEKLLVDLTNKLTYSLEDNLGEINGADYIVNKIKRVCIHDKTIVAVAELYNSKTHLAQSKVMDAVLTRSLDQEKNPFEIAWHVPLDSEKNTYSYIADIFKANTSFNILHTYKKEYLFGVVHQTHDEYKKIGYILEKLNSADSKQLVLRIMYPSYFGKEQRSLISVTLKLPENIALPQYNSQFHFIGVRGKYDETGKRFVSTTIILLIDTTNNKLYTIHLDDLHLLQQDVVYENDKFELQEYSLELDKKSFELSSIDFSVMRLKDDKFYFGQLPNQVYFSQHSLKLEAKVKENTIITLKFSSLNKKNNE